jgi:3-phosphoshikimate 1-carboxyvinyltransferase
VCAALAHGESVLSNVPDGDDTVAMRSGLTALGIALSSEGTSVTIEGSGGRLTAGAVRLDARLAGTTSRFLTAVAALAPGPVTVDGDPPLRARPMAPLHGALATLGATIEPAAAPGRLPVTVGGPLSTGGRLELPGDVSSQFLTALMLIAPLLDGGLRVELTTSLVSRPYVELTAAVMAAFGVRGVEVGERSVVVPAGRYAATRFAVDPDASSASYPLAMAAVAGGRVEVRGLRLTSPQGDAWFADLLGQMGCTVFDGPHGMGIERDRAVPLTGIDVDLAQTSDLVPTLAVVAATASSPSTITGVGFIRGKESDRLADLAAELRKLGAAVMVEDDGLRIDPAGELHGAALDVHHDHRLAMAFGVLACAVSEIEVQDPDVVAKSWPGFWRFRDQVLAA